MFHTFDNDGQLRRTDRPEWMALLARAPLEMLESEVAPFSAEPQWLRPPETGLYMVQGRAGATGERFNLGEVTVTRCALRLPSDSTGEVPAVGLAYVLGRSRRKAHLAAAADALLQDPDYYDALDIKLLEPLRRHLELQTAQRYAKAQSSKVDFFTVARETNGNDDEREDE